MIRPLLSVPGPRLCKRHPPIALVVHSGLDVAAFLCIIACRDAVQIRRCHLPLRRHVDPFAQKARIESIDYCRLFRELSDGSGLTGPRANVILQCRCPRRSSDTVRCDDDNGESNKTQGFSQATMRRKGTTSKPEWTTRASGGFRLQNRGPGTLSTGRITRALTTTFAAIRGYAQTGTLLASPNIPH